VKTLQEFKGELTEKEEIELIDLLEITSYDIVDRFDDRVEEHWEDDGRDDELEEDCDE
jgi:hypothetical protein